MPVFTFTEGPQLAGSRRSGDEIHPWVPNGDLRPNPDTRRNVCSEIETYEGSLFA